MKGEVVDLEFRVDRPWKTELKVTFWWSIGELYFIANITRKDIVTYF